MLKKIYNEDRRDEKEGRVYYSTKLICDNCNKEIISEDYNYCPYCGSVLKTRPSDDHPCITGITLLSKEEAETLLTKEEKAYKNHWWLRIPGGINYSTCYVRDCGYIHYDGLGVYSNSYCVRPALKINLSISNFKVGDIFSFGGKEFKIISNSLAWMHKDDIGSCTFHKNKYTQNTNIYETSEVKQYIENWLHNVIFKKV